MPERDQTLLRKRIKVVESFVEQNKGLKAAAKELGLSAPGLSQYLDACGYRDLRIDLGAQTRIALCLPEEVHRERLQAIVDEGSQAAAARKLGLTPPGMSKWLKHNGYGPNFKADLLDLMYEDDIDDE